MSLVAIKEDWTPADAIEHRAWKAKMYAKPEPKPDPLAAKIEIAADPERAALENRVHQLEDDVEKMRTLLEAKAKRDFQIDGFPIQVADVIRAACTYYSVTRPEMLSNRRTTELVRHRQVAMYVAKQVTSRSLPDIGRRFGNKDHTTVLHSVRKISALVLTDSILCQEVAELEALFA